jgi:pyruvate, water dikinase
MSDGLYILEFPRISASDHARVGGKCASLGVMTQAGVAVPPGFAVTTEAYAAMFQHHGLADIITAELATANPDDVDAVDAAAARVRAHICQRPLPEAVEAEIRAGYAALGGASFPVAVRSSATAEDLPDASFAGQQDTYLWVIGADTVLEKVRDCWASLYTARAIAYRNKNNIPHAGVLMSVAVQKMVNARAAGVAMTLDPVTGDRTRIIIDASWGLGETVVSGTVTPDNFTVEKILEQIVARKISDKHMELVGDPALGRAVEREVDALRRGAQCLTDAEVLAVARLAKRLERQNKCPQDVEWAIDADLPEGENVVALQSRPETVWSQKKAADSPKTYVTGMMGIVGTLNNPIASRK